jgi:hypothetical protein
MSSGFVKTDCSVFIERSGDNQAISLRALIKVDKIYYAGLLPDEGDLAAYQPLPVGV